MKKANLTARQHWLANRIKDCVKSINELAINDGWPTYKNQAKELAQELLYAVTEWEKYYEKDV